MIINKEKFVITGKLLADSKGVKMGKSLGNVINLTDKASDIYGKVMSFSDGMIIPGFEILTEIDINQVQEIERKIEKEKQNPIEFKKILAYEVTKWIKGEKEAQNAQIMFEKTIQNKEVPVDIKTIKFSELKEKKLSEILTLNKIASSKSEFKRFIEQGGVEINNKKIVDVNFIVDTKDLPLVIKFGKRKWLKII